jgi:hypothetical protein
MNSEDSRDGNADGQRLEPDIRQHIGLHLQAAFAEVETGPIPDEHVELLLALRRTERERQRGET